MATIPAVERVTVNLTQKSSDALTRAAATDGLNKTDTINRALQLYDWVLDQRERLGFELAVIGADDKVRRVLFLS